MQESPLGKISDSFATYFYWNFSKKKCYPHLFMDAEREFDVGNLAYFFQEFTQRGNKCVFFN